MAVPDDRPPARPRHVRPADEPAESAEFGTGFDRQPPQDLAAEQSVLGGMLLSKDAIADVVEVLRPGDFYRPAHRTVFDCILDLYGRGEPADPVTVSAELQRRGELVRVGGAPYLHTLIAGVPTAANAAYYAEIVAEKAILRRLVEAGTRIVQLGYLGAAGAGGAGVDEVVDRAQTAIYDVTERRTSEDYVPLEELLQPTMDEIDAIASRGGVSLGVPTGFADLDAVTNGLHPGQMIVLAARPGLGKALALDTPLPTPSGWTTMGEVAVGDQLIAADGTPTTVVAATEVMHGRPCFEVVFCDGSVITADADHEWLTQSRAERRAASRSVRTTAQLAASVRRAGTDSRVNHSVTVCEPLVLPERSLPIEPYAFGVWLGGGTADAAADPEISAFVDQDGYRAVRAGSQRDRGRPSGPTSPRRRVGCGAGVGPRISQIQARVRSCGGKPWFDRVAMPPTAGPCGDPPSCGPGGCPGAVRAVLGPMGALGGKHIPIEYLRASERQRRAVLAGVMDALGTVTTTGDPRLAVTSRRLAEQVRELVVSLGYRCSVSTEPARGHGGETVYTLSFTTSEEVFRLGRKRRLHKERSSARGSRPTPRYITDVRRLASVPVRCVQVDHDRRLYLAGHSMIPTHNSTLGLDFARSCSVRHGMTSAIFSLEMSRSEIVMRLLSAEARIRLTDMRAGRMSDDDWTRMARRMSEISEAPLFIDDSPNLTMMEIRAKARRLRQRNDLRLLIVDYLQLMTSGKRVESRQQEVSEFSRHMKLLAKELEVPVVAISQLNRGPEQRTDKRPMLADLRESGSIEQDADMVILLHRPDAFERDDPRAGEADLILAKHRNGPTNTITVAHQLHYSRFADLAH